MKHSSLNFSAMAAAVLAVLFVGSVPEMLSAASQPAPGFLTVLAYLSGRQRSHQYYLGVGRAG